MQRYFTSFDKGHRHSVELPLGALASLKLSMPGAKEGLGLATGGTHYRGVYRNNQLIGWAWSTAYDANIVNQNSGCIASRIQVLDDAPGGFWDRVFRSAPAFKGSRQWFAVWLRSQRKFIGWYDVGMYTAQVIGLHCHDIDVFNRHGLQIR